MAVSISNNIANKEYSSQSLRSSQATSGDVSRNSGSINISKLSAGSTISGEVISKDGNQVTLKLSNNQTLSAKLDGNANIDVGQKVTFEVAKSGLSQTTLRPLYSNLSSNSAVSVALKEAQLPITDNNIAFTSQMMKEGMAVNRNALWNMAKTVSSFPNADPTTIVQMSKIGIEINQTNISQFDNYKNFQHQIIEDASSIANGLNDMLKESLSIGEETPFNVNITKEILSLVDTSTLEVLDSGNESIMLDGELLENNVFIGEPTTEIGVNDVASNGQFAEDVDVANVNQNVLEINNGIVNTNENVVIEGTVDKFIANTNLSLDEGEQQRLLNNLNDILTFTGKESSLDVPINAGQVIDIVKGLVNEYLSNNDNDGMAETVNLDNNVVESGNSEQNAVTTLQEEGSASQGSNVLDNNSSTTNNINNQSTNAFTTVNADGISQRIYDPIELLKNFSQKIFGQENKVDEANTVPKTIEEQINDKITGLIKSDDFGKLFKDSIKAQFSMNPADVAKEGKIEELYERIVRTSNKIADVMSAIGKSDSAVANAAQNITDNVNFMDQLNQYLNYVQLPLKMAGEDAHGELYVYTKRKSKENEEGNFSAFLHLDMDHLGPMDVYVTMREFTKVNTHFYLQSDDLLDFIYGHIDELTKRLQEKGYSATANFSKKDPKEPITPITEQFVKNDEGTTTGTVSKLCFDVRA